MYKGKKTLGIIPARYASTRFPGKPLVNIAGKSMIQRVFEQAKKCKRLDHVVVATDHKEIYEHLKELGAEVQMTNPAAPSGTDRCATVAALPVFSDFDFVVNIQGDEPFIQPEQIEKAITILENNPNFNIATLAKKIAKPVDLFNPNVVKLVFGIEQQALYFSRNPIPYLRNVDKSAWLERSNFYKHIGLYAFQKNTLLKLAKLSPTHLETSESLEQLRWLENGYSIGIALTEIEAIGIDTPEDLEKVLQIRKGKYS